MGVPETGEDYTAIARENPYPGWDAQLTPYTRDLSSMDENSCVCFSGGTWEGYTVAPAMATFWATASPHRLANARMRISHGRIREYTKSKGELFSQPDFSGTESHPRNW